MNLDWKSVLIGAVLGWLLSAFVCHKGYPHSFPDYSSALIT